MENYEIIYHKNRFYDIINIWYDGIVGYFTWFKCGMFHK